MCLEKYDIIIKYDMIYMRWMFNLCNYYKFVYLCVNKFLYCVNVFLDFFWCLNSVGILDFNFV